MTPDPILSGSRNCKKKLCEKIEKVKIQVEENGVKLDENFKNIEGVTFLVKENGVKLDENADMIENNAVLIEKVQATVDKIEKVVDSGEEGMNLHWNGVW